jgi:hypothetical protein
MDIACKNIKMVIRETQFGSMDWIDVAQDTGQWRVLANTVIDLRG